MDKEESLEILQRIYHAQSNGGMPPLDPQFAGAIKTAIEVLIVEVSKQKIKEYLKGKKQNDRSKADE